MSLYYVLDKKSTFFPHRFLQNYILNNLFVVYLSLLKMFIIKYTHFYKQTIKILKFINSII